MKFKIVRSKFLEGLKSVQNIVASKGTLPVLQNVLLEAKKIDDQNGELTLTTTDLDISIKSTLECEVFEEGASTLPVKLLFNSISKAAEGSIEIEIDQNERATIIASSVRSNSLRVFSIRICPSAPWSSTPAVSINTTGPSGRNSMVFSTGSVVVPATGETIETS